MGDLSDDDISDSQWHDIGESYLTSSQFEDIFSDWSQGDKPENDCIQSENVVDMDCSESDRSERKRKSSELPMYNKVRVIVPNPQFNTENNIELQYYSDLGRIGNSLEQKRIQRKWRPKRKRINSNWSQKKKRIHSKWSQKRILIKWNHKQRLIKNG